MRVFITGGTSGIGLELARLYVQQGAQVGVCGFITDGFNLPEAKHYNVDVTDADALARAVADFAQGSLDVLVASAGINNNYERVDLPNFQREREIMNVNVGGVINAFGAAVPIMAKQKRGRLCALGSASGLCGFPGNAGYSASKGAIITLCEAYAIDLWRHGLTVLCANPGFVSTPLTRGNPKKMAFVITPQEAARKIKEAIDSDRESIFFPLRAHLIMLLLAALPRWFYRWLFKRVYRPLSL